MSPACSARELLLGEGSGGQLGLIPDWLTFSTSLTLHPRGSGLLRVLFLGIHRFHLVDVEILIVVGSDPENTRPRQVQLPNHYVFGVLMSATGSRSMPHNEIASTPAEVTSAAAETFSKSSPRRVVAGEMTKVVPPLSSSRATGMFRA